MPSQTYHLRREHMDYLDAEADRRGLDNPSQALKAILDEHQEEYE